MKISFYFMKISFVYGDIRIFKNIINVFVSNQSKDANDHHP